MAFILADRVEQVTRTTGTGDLVLAETPSGRQSFSDVASMSDTMLYVLEDGNGSDWEIGLGTLSIGAETVLERTTVRQSTNADAKISLTSAAHRVYLVADAALLDDFARKSTANTFTETQQVSGDANDYLEVKSTDDADKSFLRILDSNDNVVGRLRVLNMDGVGAGDLDIDTFDAVQVGPATDFLLEPTLNGFGLDYRAYNIGVSEASAPADLDNITESGFYRVSKTGTANRPINLNGSVIHMAGFDSDSAMQIYYTYDNNWTSYVRHKNVGVWSSWRFNFTTGNILGTVSQSGGTPTGAIIEQGSNANGEYTRFADGTQICSFKINVVSGGPATWTFPAVFSSAPDVTGTGRASGTMVIVTITSETTTGASVYTWDGSAASPTGVSNTPTVMAIGRWF